MEMDYMLKWPERNTLHEKYRSFPETKGLVDITLLCEDRMIRAHKLVLASCSLYFGALFQQYPEANVIVLHHVSYKDLEIVIDFMYSGNLPIHWERLTSILYIIKGLKVRAFSKENNHCPLSPPFTVFVCSPTQIPSLYTFPSDFPTRRTPLEPSLPPNHDLREPFQPTKNPPKKKLLYADDMVSTTSVSDVRKESLIRPPLKAVPTPHPSTSTPVTYQESLSKQSEIEFSDIRAAGSVSNASLNVPAPIITSRNFPTSPGRSNSLQQANNDTNVMKQCIFCEGRCRGRLMPVGNKLRDLLKTEILNKDEHIYRKLLDYEKLFIHTECKKKYANASSQNKPQKKVPKRKGKRRRKAHDLISSTEESDAAMYDDESEGSGLCFE